MKIPDCQILFSDSLSTTSITAPENTHINRIAELELEMARAYESDGITFYLSGDPVNALACFHYGFGWLHFGLSSGLFASAATPVCPFLEPHEHLQAVYSSKLEEKTLRYLGNPRHRQLPDPNDNMVSKRINVLLMFMLARNTTENGSLEDALQVSVMAMDGLMPE
jgi:hypothetical protein